MALEKKPKRRYNSTRRQAQARETRHQIAEAAGKLFIAGGYAGTTIDSIAQEAGVSPETIYAVFGNKRALLIHLIGIAVGGDDRPVPLLQRPKPHAVLHELDPRQQIRLFAQDITGILERVTPIFEVMRLAARSEPEIADLLKEVLKERLHNMTIFVQALSAHSPLRAGMTETRAVETVWTLSSPEVFHLLTIDRTWSSEQYTDWLADALSRLLLP